MGNLQDFDARGSSHLATKPYSSCEPLRRNSQVMGVSVMRPTRDIGSEIDRSKLEGKPIGLDGSSTGFRV